MNIKKTIKKIINSGKRIDSDDLIKRIQDYQYVSFDIFDTLVKRNVENPNDIFSIMEKMTYAGFKSERITAEKRARKELGKKEVTIDDIYSFFPVEKRESLINLEIETELKSIVPNQPIADVYNKCIKEGKTVFITSDMYWPIEAIEALLAKTGFKDYKKIYLSCSCQKVKSDGSLFRYLLENEIINPNSLVHIGDSITSDYKEPKKLGISAVLIPRYYHNIRFRGDKENNSIELNYLNHFINNVFPYTEDLYYQFGFSQFGKLLYGYVHWIHDEAVKRGIKKIFFFSRDGYIMKQAYEACVPDKSIDVRYLEVSRRSLRVPILWMDCDYDTVLNMIVNSKLITLESIFDGLGLDINLYEQIIKKHGLIISEVFDRNTIRNDVRLNSLINDIRSDIIQNSKEEYKLLKEYLKENDVQGKFAVVDIGYGGSMQRYLQQTLTKINIDYDIVGFYLAVADFYTKNILPCFKLDLNGYLFDYQHNPNSQDTRRSFVGLFETLFLEQGGSVKRYVADNDGVIAERYPYEYETDGKPTEDLNKIRRIQKGAIDFVRSASNDEIMKKLNCRPDEYFAGLQLVGEDPSMKDLKLFGDISFYDEGMTEKLAAPKSVPYYVIHPKQLKEDFLKCRWKTGFLKRLCKVNLPYQSLYEKLRNLC